MGKLEGKVAFITGAARGQGRSHAIRLAQEGADIIGIDICKQIATVGYAMAEPADLDQTVKEVEALDRRMVAIQADVRDIAAMQSAYDEGVAALGPVEIVLANAGIGPGSPEPSDQDWLDALAVNLTGVWNTGRVAIPSMIEAGNGGAIVLTSSTGGLMGPGSDSPGLLGYTVAKHGVVGLMRCWANFLAPHFIRVNSVAPTSCRTPMAANLNFDELMNVNPMLASALTNAMPVNMVEPLDVSNAIAWLVSDEARYVTGSVIPVDAGCLNKR